MLKLGKLSNEELSKLVLNQLPHMRAEVLQGPGIGEDCAAMRIDGLCVISSDPITAANNSTGWLAVNVACNDIAAAGGKPIAIMITLLVPPRSSLQEIEAIMNQVSTASTELEVEVIGGHTEVTDSVTRPIISSTVIGIPAAVGCVPMAGAQVGDLLIMTKYAGIEGTAIIAGDFADRSGNILSAQELAEAGELMNRISVVKDGVLAAQAGAHAMHDATEGGILGAAYEMAQAAGLGILVEAEKVSVLPVTKKLTTALGIDPLRLISSGCMLIAAPKERNIAEQLSCQGIPASVIGIFTKSGMQEMRDGQIFPLLPPEKDELYKMF